MATVSSPPKSESEALCEEFQLIHDRPVQVAPREQGEAVPREPELRDYRYSVHRLPGGQSALCLSGGGVRSAAFSLGVLQALAQRKLLCQFHYLSTVSGGGYIGSWLIAWAHRVCCAKEGGGRSAAEAFETVQSGLNQRPLDREGESGPFDWLRKNQRFLSPRAGMMSGDAWAGIALFLRDLVLNWLVYLPAIAGVLLLPRVLEFLLVFWASYAYEAGSGFGWLIQGGILNPLRALVGQQPANVHFPALPGFLDVLGAAIVLSGMRVAMVERTQPFAADRRQMDDRAFRRWILTPVLIGGWLLVMFNAATLAHGAHPDMTLLAQWCIGTPLVFVLARVFASPGRTPRAVVLTRQVWLELGMLAVAGAVVGALVWLGLLLRMDAPGATGTARDFVVFGLPWLLLAFMGGQVLYAGLSSTTEFGRRDQEWLGRASGHYLLAALAWAVLFGLILYGEPLQERLFSVLAVSGTAGALTLGTAVSTVTKARTALGTARQFLPGTILLQIGLFVFLVGACIALAVATEWLIWQALGKDLRTLGNVLTGKLHAVGQLGILPIMERTRGKIWNEALRTDLLAVCCALLLFLFSYVASLFVDVNVFSLHGLYRTRLVRTFLGASNAADPTRNRFDGFAEGDDVPLDEIWRDGSGGRRREGPFPVLNMALNLVGSQDLAVQDRKAESFAATPLGYGAATVGYTEHDQGRRRKNLSLGTAMAISGAAASPNWGYHSSTLIGFLLMLFNLRLGWWIENPKRYAERKPDGGRSSRLFLQEALGQTSDADPYIYLSDGGHFDNLGVYEMFRRRCSLIVAVDATQDGDYTLEDLGRALRTASVDLGATVEFEPILLKKRADPAAPGVYAALGTITYYERPGPEDRPCTFIYIKPGFLDDAPADIRAYAASNAKFPHDSTLNQFFTESQFESYRALGVHAIARMLGPPRDLRTAELRVLVEDYLTKAASPKQRTEQRVEA